MDKHDQIPDSAIIEHIERNYSEALDIHDLTVTGERRYNGRIGVPPPARAVVNVYIVGPTNAGTYRGWLAMPKPAWGRVFSAKPEGWAHYILMVGLQPDGQSIWWSAMYDEAKVAALGYDPEWARAGFGRLPAHDLTDALAAPLVDALQVSLPWKETAEEPIAAEPIVAEPIAEDGPVEAMLQVLSSYATLDTLSLGELARLQERLHQIDQQIFRLAWARGKQGHGKRKIPTVTA